MLPASEWATAVGLAGMRSNTVVRAARRLDWSTIMAFMR